MTSFAFILDGASLAFADDAGSATQISITARVMDCVLWRAVHAHSRRSSPPPAKSIGSLRFQHRSHDRRKSIRIGK